MEGGDLEGTDQWTIKKKTMFTNVPYWSYRVARRGHADKWEERT